MDKIKHGLQTKEHEQNSLNFSTCAKIDIASLRGRAWILHAHITVQGSTAGTRLNTHNAKMKV